MACAALALVCALARADVHYTVEPIGDLTRIKVTMQFAAGPGPVELQMPNWSPGDYELKIYGKRVQDFHGRDAAGEAIAFEHPADNSWMGVFSEACDATVDYTVPAHFEAEALHYGGPGSYLYVVGRKDERCHLSLVLPPEWKVAVGLDAVGEGDREYDAPGYDVLADNPVTAGVFLDLHYVSHEKPMTIALRGELRTSVDREKLLKLCQTVSDFEGDFFGELPFHKYVWHMTVLPTEDGGAGLEHLSSTQVLLARGLGPATARVCAHEFFHLWNVKRIRPRVLGPFDYTQLPKTGALYWMEGVTDYYASLLLLRSGYLGEDAFLKDLVDNATQALANPARLEVSLQDSSARVGEANEGRGNGSGWRVSFYNEGWLAAACLDLDLRSQTEGKHSLDDVERALWEICSEGPGFEEGEIEQQYVRLGGSKEFFEQVVANPGEIPIDLELEEVGLRLERSATSFVDKGFGLSYTNGSPNITVDDLRPAAAAAGLASGDLLLEINGTPIVGATMEESVSKLNAALGKVDAGTVLQLKVRHAGDDKSVTVTAFESSKPVLKAVDASDGDPEKLARRKNWYLGGTRG